LTDSQVAVFMMDPSSSSEGTLLLPTESPGSIQSDLSHPEVTSASK